MILYQIAVMSIVCYGAYVGMAGLLNTYNESTRSNLFDWLIHTPDGKKIMLLKWILTPILGCIVCAATFWGNLTYFALFDFQLFEWLACWLGCAALNWVLSHWFEL